uniref:Uncharacterized protein n=1 Tax=Nelumbo nucifera TaxID=4432 RepID=A0A822ZMU1_NELNU|nr:TPA_asm: hypothetical protein HUJ06_004323 [Nelumbo nucifera]
MPVNLGNWLRASVGNCTELHPCGKPSGMELLGGS